MSEEKMRGLELLETVIERIESIRFDLDYMAREKENEVALESGKCDAFIDVLSETVDDLQTYTTDLDMELWTLEKQKKET